MSYLIFHPKQGWYCKDDYGRHDEKYFSESHHESGVAVWFETIESAQKEFINHPEKYALEIYYPIEEKGKKLFLKPS